MFEQKIAPNKFSAGSAQISFRCQQKIIKNFIGIVDRQSRLVFQTFFKQLFVQAVSVNINVVGLSYVVLGGIVDDFSIIFFCCVVKRLKRIQHYEIVAVYEKNVFAARELKTYVARSAGSARILFHLGKLETPAESFNVTLDNFKAVIG